MCLYQKQVHDSNLWWDEMFWSKPTEQTHANIFYFVEEFVLKNMWLLIIDFYLIGGSCIPQLPSPFFWNRMKIPKQWINGCLAYSDKIS